MNTYITCTGCLEPKPRHEFGDQKEKCNGKKSACRVCNGGHEDDHVPIPRPYRIPKIITRCLPFH